jgi:hypothetical protein
MDYGAVVGYGSVVGYIHILLQDPFISILQKQNKGNGLFCL